MYDIKDTLMFLLRFIIAGGVLLTLAVISSEGFADALVRMLPF
jgi:hypothetical protein